MWKQIEKVGSQLRSGFTKARELFANIKATGAILQSLKSTEIGRKQTNVMEGTVDNSRRENLGLEDIDRNSEELEFGRVLKLTYKKLVFGARVTGLANDYREAFAGIGFSPMESQTASPEAISLNQAFEEDRKGWTMAIIKELKALETTGTFTIMRG
ncbi:hypothetical protein EPUL_005017, partial [Erysiphe pulchra]